MKRLAVLYLALLLSDIPAQAQDKTRIVALENSWNQAGLHNDAHAVDLLLADDFVMTVADGYTLNKAAMLASVRDTSCRPHLRQYDNMEVHMYGNTRYRDGIVAGKRQG